MLDGYVIFIIGADEVENDEEIKIVSLTNIIPVIMMIYTACISLCLIPMGFYHTKLALFNTTTNEEMRDTFDKKYRGKNPFNEGC